MDKAAKTLSARNPFRRSSQDFSGTQTMRPGTSRCAIAIIRTENEACRANNAAAGRVIGIGAVGRSRDINTSRSAARKLITGTSSRRRPQSLHDGRTAAARRSGHQFDADMFATSDLHGTDGSTFCLFAVAETSRFQDGLMDQGCTSNSTLSRSFRRPFSQPISWFGTGHRNTQKYKISLNTKHTTLI